MDPHICAKVAELLTKSCELRLVPGWADFIGPKFSKTSFNFLFPLPPLLSLPFFTFGQASSNFDTMVTSKSVLCLGLMFMLILSSLIPNVKAWEKGTP